VGSLAATGCAKGRVSGMVGLSLSGRLQRVLCLGAHSDDIEIGAGATILRWTRENPGLSVCWVVFSGNAIRQAEARESARLFLARARSAEIITHQFRDGFFPSEADRIKEAFEQLKRSFSPDVILTHTREDRHQDHRTISDLTWNTWRNHLVLEYEIPKYDGDLAQPNAFVALEEAHVADKVAYLREGFASQSDKHWFTDETFRAILRLRGIESANRYAEAFHCRKMCL
jgi:LmbE family N-acetylglucosaminyl deacetylase